MLFGSLGIHRKPSITSENTFYIEILKDWLEKYEITTKATKTSTRSIRFLIRSLFQFTRRHLGFKFHMKQLLAKRNQENSMSTRSSDTRVQKLYGVMSCSNFFGFLRQNLKAIKSKMAPFDLKLRDFQDHVPSHPLLPMTYPALHLVQPWRPSPIHVTHAISQAADKDEETS